LELEPSDLDFTSFVAAELKEHFDKKFFTYKNQLSEIHKIAPKNIFF
jgi:hypothetical protein